MFSKEDLDQIKQKGLSKEQVSEQLNLFKTGFPPLRISKPASAGDGIIKSNSNLLVQAVQEFDAQIADLKPIKFIPASGAATRMFKELIEFMQSYQGSEVEYLELLSKRTPDSIYYFFENIKSFAFYEDLKTYFLNHVGQDLDKLLENNEFVWILKGLITNVGLNYGSLPKALIKFHNYKMFCRTAFEEQLLEAKGFCTDNRNAVNLHFTVAENFLNDFEILLKEISLIHKEKYGIKYKVDFSVQNPSTDTIAADENNEPFRDEKGRLVFRPGGHGALLYNLNHIKNDLIFIKNIDNVVPDRLKEENIHYKKVLGGVLLIYQSQIFDYINLLKKSKTIDDSKMIKMIKFLEKDLCIIPPVKFNEWKFEEKTAYLLAKFNRPIRVCGMVENEGEPGGGPFFVYDADGSQSLQIVESSQIDKSNSEQTEMMVKSTHFNPVDIVCSTKDYRGRKFDLSEFTDPNTGFISSKSKDGKELKALEWPGLWNGAMSNWNTVFVEVPIITFNPVKVVNDLLREEHLTLAFLQWTDR